MNALTVLSVAALAACSSGQILNYPGIYGYSGLLPAAAPVILKSVAHTPVTFNAVSSTPLAYNVAPFAPVAPIQTQYHAQDELGQYSFGYAGGPSSRAETRDPLGIVRGSYNYVDSDGKIQTQHYVADALGFRVSGTNLPVAPDAPVAAPLALPGPLPEPVEETPEVVAAKAAHQSAYNEAAAAAAAAPDRKKRSVVAVAPHVGTYSPLHFSYGFSTPLAYSHPAVVGSPLQYTATAAHPAITTYAHAAHPAFATYAHAAHPAIATYTTAGVPAGTAYTAASAAPRDAELLRVVHNPNHAVSYRVD